MSYFSASKELTIVVDRTQWRELNLLMVSIIWQQRAIPLHWCFIPVDTPTAKARGILGSTKSLAQAGLLQPE
jgi:hypothetical protein